MTGIYLLLGSNLGNKKGNLADARKLILQQIGAILQKSALYVTEPWGMSEAPGFLNQVLKVKTRFEPLKVLDNILEIESRLGRTRQYDSLNRTIDIDLLYYHHEVIDHPTLHVPHPRISARNFVLIPLTEIAPNFLHPVLELTNQQLLEQCTDTLSVTPFKS